MLCCMPDLGGHRLLVYGWIESAGEVCWMIIGHGSLNSIECVGGGYPANDGPLLLPLSDSCLVPLLLSDEP